MKNDRVITINLMECEDSRTWAYEISNADYKSISKMMDSAKSYREGVPVLGEKDSIQSILRKYKPLCAIDRSF